MRDFWADLQTDVRDIWADLQPPYRGRERWLIGGIITTICLTAFDVVCGVKGW